MRRTVSINLFCIVLTFWVVAWSLGVLGGTILASRAQHSRLQAVADHWAEFLRRVIEPEIGPIDGQLDEARQSHLQDVAERWEIGLVLFDEQGKELLSEGVGSVLGETPAEVRGALETKKLVAAWDSSHNHASTQLRAAWPLPGDDPVRVVWVIQRVTWPSEFGSAVPGVWLFWACGCAIGIPIAGLASRWGRITCNKLLEAIMQSTQTMEVSSIISEFRELGQSAMRTVRAIEEERDNLRKIAADHQAVMDNLSDGLIFTDAAARILQANSAALRMLRLAPAAARGLGLRECLRHPDWLAWLDGLLNGRAVHSIPVSFDNPEQHLEIAGSQLRDGEGKVRGLLVVIRDVTPSRLTDRVRRDFVANVSHELRTPLTSIKGFLETLLEGALDDPAQARRFVRIVYEQTERLENIVNDLLTLTRLESEHDHPIERERLPAATILQEVIHACAFQAEQKNITLDWDVSQELAVDVNPRLFQQALINLVDNAIKYSDPGKQVEIRAWSGGAEITFEVRDQGWGIEARHLSRVFERFYRVDAGRSRQMGGTGLGLAIVKHVAQVHGGRVSAESQVGRGSTFRIHLPLISEGPGKAP